MSMLYDEGQQAIAHEARRILEARMTVEGLLPLLETTGQWHQPFWTIAKEQGWTALAVGEPFGGLALGLVELGLIAHQAGRSISGAPFLTSGFGVATAIERHGSADLQARWLPALASGTAIGAVALSPGAALPEVRRNDNRLSGGFAAVPAGLAADVLLLFAQQAGTPLLAVAALEGAERTAVAGFDNSCCHADLRLADAPADILLTGEAAQKAALHILAAQAVVTAHEQTGGAEMLMERARDQALSRRAFGQPIGAFQSIKHRIAELYALVEIARANCIGAAFRADAADFVVAAAAARLAATEAYDTAARDCTHIHGGMGATWDMGLHLHLRRARTLAIEQGNSLFWEDILVDHLAGAAA